MRYQINVTNEEMNLLLGDYSAGVHQCHKALVVGGDEKLLRRVVGILREEHFFVYRCRDPVMALNRCRNENFDLVLSGALLPGLDGVEMLTFVKHLLPGAYRVLLGGATDKSTLIRAINSARIDAFIEEPLCGDQFRSVIAGMFPIS